MPFNDLFLPLTPLVVDWALNTKHLINCKRGNTIQLLSICLGIQPSPRRRLYVLSPSRNHMMLTAGADTTQTRSSLSGLQPSQRSHVSSLNRNHMAFCFCFLFFVLLHFVQAIQLLWYLPGILSSRLVLLFHPTARLVCC